MTAPLPRPLRFARSLHRPCALPFAVLALTLAALTPQDAQANPKKVAEILQSSGSSAVVRGPGTINNQVKAKLEGQAAALASKTGGKVFLVIVNGNTGVGAYAKLYDTLGLGKGDVLIASNGKKWALRCNGISKADKSRLLKQVMSAGGDPMARMSGLMSGIPSALGHSQKQGKKARSTGAATAVGTAAAVESSSGFGFGAIFFLLLLVGGVGFVIWRRKQRDAALEAEFRAAIDPAENHMAEFYLGSDGLEGHPQFDQLLSQATGISGQIDALKAATPTREAISKAKTLTKQAAEMHQSLKRLN